MTKQGKKIKWLDMALLQLSVVVYSLSTVAANLASRYKFPDLNFILFFGLDFIMLAIYAILWQQVIKKFQLSVAYANKSGYLMWSMLWNYLILSQGITRGRVIGVLLVMAGVIAMNMGEGSND